MLYGVMLETALCFILAYTPGIQTVFMSRPINFYMWCCGMLFSMTLLAWCETRKYLLRRPAAAGKVNFFEKNVNW
jgi:sodium/potassium-transporting ATPase subunit alpha